jgi:exopolysaccharide production protein ExoZ
LKTNTKLNNIQVLRAFAALSVVVYHTGFAFPSLRNFGSYGVDVFFVISGYIMARILDDRLQPNLAPGAHPGDFFLRRRILRIVPPYWFFTLLLFFVSMRLPALMGSTRASYIELFKSLFFIPFAKYGFVIQPLLFIGWSLNYEMFFYLALAIGVLIHKRFAFRIPSVTFGAALVLVTMLACMPFRDSNVLATFYSRDLSLEFLLGILSYYVCRAFSDASARRLRFPALFICIVCTAALIAVQGLLPSLPMSRVVTLGIPSFLLVTAASLLSQAGWDTRLTGLVLIGDASYILYLIHPYCEYSIDRILGPHHPWLRRDTATGAFIGVTLSVVLALLVHLYGERPTVKFLNRNYGGKRKSTEFATPAAP